MRSDEALSNSVSILLPSDADTALDRAIERLMSAASKKSARYTQRLGFLFAAVTLSAYSGSEDNAKAPSIAVTQSYTIHYFSETEKSEGYWYAGVYNEPSLISYFPQGGIILDVLQDSTTDIVVPMNKGYRSGGDTRMHFFVFKNDGTLLEFDEDLTLATPFITGARRSSEISINYNGEATNAFVTVAHDTTGETQELSFGTPWKYGDISIILLSDMRDVAEELIVAGSLPLSASSGRETATNAHSMAVGDITGNGLQDILVGEFSSAFVLEQKSDGTFVIFGNEFLREGFGGNYNWQQGGSDLILDMHILDANGNEIDDVIVGWGHGNQPSAIFYNDGAGGFSPDNMLVLPEPIYGWDNSLHLATWSEDFDGDGLQEIIILYSRYEPFYGGYYLQFLKQDENGVFVDETVSRLGDPFELANTFGPRLNWHDQWYLVDVNGDGLIDIAGYSIKESKPVIYRNDGTGIFDKLLIDVDLSAIITEVYDFPVGGNIIAWGDFDNDGNMDFLTSWQTCVDSECSASMHGFTLFSLSEII